MVPRGCVRRQPGGDRLGRSVPRRRHLGFSGSRRRDDRVGSGACGVQLPDGADLGDRRVEHRPRALPRCRCSGRRVRLRPRLVDLPHPRDTPDALSRRSPAQHGRSTLALVRHLAGVDLTTPRVTGDATYFTVGRHTVVRYPATLDTTIAALALVLLLVLGRGGNVPIGRGAGRMAGLVAGLAIVAAGAWWVVGSWRPEMGLVEAELWLVAMTLAASAAGLIAARQWGAPSPLSTPLLWTVVALAVSVGLPGTGAIFAWPALGAAITLSVRPPVARLVAGAITAIVALVLAVPVVDVLFVFAQPRPGNADSQILWFAALPIAIAALVALHLFAVLQRPREHAVPDPG